MSSPSAAGPRQRFGSHGCPCHSLGWEHRGRWVPRWHGAAVGDIEHLRPSPLRNTLPCSAESPGTSVILLLQQNWSGEGNSGVVHAGTGKGPERCWCFPVPFCCHPPLQQAKLGCLLRVQGLNGVSECVHGSRSAGFPCNGLTGTSLFFLQGSAPPQQRGSWEGRRDSDATAGSVQGVLHHRYLCPF